VQYLKIIIIKKNDISQIQTDPVFTYLCSEIGESRDIYRFDIEQDDLKEAVNMFNAFKGSKKYFSSINNDKRCKIQSIDWFKNNIRDWNVDRNWNESEKIELGIAIENKPLLYNEFIDLVNDVATKIAEDTNLISECANFDTIYKEEMIEKLFDLPPIKGLASAFIQKNQGIIPVMVVKNMKSQ
jgi:hypothetical protein